MFRLGLRIAAVTLIVDQISKWLLLYAVDMPNRGLIEITPYFNLRMVWNPGVSFGMFSADNDFDRYALVAFALAVVSLLLIWLARSQGRLLAWAIGLVVGGALGNVIDRLFYGAVADFFDFHLMGYHFYTFNVADMAISFGVILLLYDAIFFGQPEREKKAEQES